MKRFVGFTFMILFGIMFLANVVSACVDLSDPSTWDGRVAHAGPSYLISDSITLCPGSVTISDPLVIDNDGVVVDGNGAEITVSNEILVLLANHKDVVIKDVTFIREYTGSSEFCVELHDDENITLENVTVYSDTPCRLSVDRVNNSVIENCSLHTTVTSPNSYTCVHMFDSNNITFDHTMINSSRICSMPLGNLKNSTVKNNIFRNVMLFVKDPLDGTEKTEYNLIYNNTFYQDNWGGHPIHAHAILVNPYPENSTGDYTFNHNIIAYNRFYNYSSDEIYFDFAANNHLVCNEFVDTRPSGWDACDDAIDVNYHTSNLTIEYNVVNLSTPNDDEHAGGLRGGFLQYEQQLNTGENNTIQFNTIYYDSGNETNGVGVLDLLGPTNELNFYKNKFFIKNGRLFHDPPNLYNSTFVDNIICTTVTQPVDPTVNFVNNTCDNGPAYGCVRSCSELAPEDYEPYACPIVIHDDDTITINGTVEINPGQPVLRTLDDLYCVADISEIADDVVTVNWYRNGMFYRSETVVCDDHPGDPYQHCTSGFVPNTDTLKHDEWTCEVIATLSGHPTSFNTSRVIENTPPQPPVLVTPIGGITVESPVDFDWDDAYDPDVLEGTDSLVYKMDVSGPTSFHETGLTSTSRSNVVLSAGWYEWHVKACDDEAVCSGWSDTETFVIRDTEPNEPQFNVHKSYDKRCAVVGEPVTITLYYNRTVNSHHPADVPPVINVTVEDGLIDNVTLDESSLPSECYTIGNVIYCPQGTVEEGDEGWVSFVVYPTEPGINITLNTDPSGINLTGDYEGFIEFNQPVITVCPPGYHCSEDGTGCVRDVIHLHTDEVLNATVKPNPAYTNDTLHCYVNVNVTDPEGADLHIRWMVAEPIDPLGLHHAPYEHRPEYDQVIHVNPGVHLVVSGPVDHLKKHERWMCIPYFVMVPLEGPTADVLNRPPGPVTEFLPDVSGYTCGRNWTVAWMPGDDPDGDEIVGYRVYLGNETEQTWVDDTSYPTYTFDNLVPGERYCYYVKETDGEAWSNASVKHCIDVVDCRCPYVDNVTLTPEVTTVGHEITCRAHVTDPRLSGIILPDSKASKLTKVRFGGHDDWLDGDVPVSPPTTSPYTYSYRITWYHNGRLLGYDELTDVNTLEPEASVPIYEPGEVTCEVCVLCDPDSPLGPMGCEYQGCMNGTAEVVDIPVKTVEVTPDPAYTREDLLCDIELNESTTRTITVEWWVNGMKVKEYSDFVCLNGHCNVTLNHSYTRKHDLVTCVARSSYGAVNDTAHVINTPPTPPMPVHPRPGEITLNDWMDGRFISNDDDEDPLMYYVYGGTSPDPSRMVLLGNVGYYPYDDREGMYNWTGLTPGKYYMYAVAYDGEDYSEDGLVTMFVVRPVANISVEVTADGGIRDYPETYDTVRCTARIDEDTVSEWPVNVRFVWYRNGTEYTQEDVTCDGSVCEWATVITPDENDKFDNWTCEAIVCTDTSGSPYPDDPVSYVCDSANDSVVLQNIPPDTPTLITPHDHAVIMMDEEPIRFEVQGTDPDDTRLEYHVILMDESGGVIDTVVDEGEGGITFDRTLPVGTYRWKARSYDRYNWSGWSDEWTFTVVTVPQVKVQIESDNDGVDPNMFETTDDLICKGNVSGVTEEHTVTVVWYRDGEVYSTTEATCLPTGTGGYECRSDLISNDDTVKHQVWRCVMNVCNTINGEDYCSSDSDEEEIQNLPPSVPDLVTPDDYKVIKTTKLPETNYPNLDYLTVEGEPYEEEDIKLDVTDSFDYDYDPLTYTFVGTDGSGREFVNEDTDVSEMNIGMLDSGDYTWWVNVTDGETVVTSEQWHFSVDVNHPPFIQAQVVPTTIHSGDYVRCDMDWLWDEDNDDVNVTFYLVNVTDPDHPVIYEGGTFFLNSSDPDTYSNDEYYGGRFHDTVGNYTHAHDVLSTGVGPVHKGESWRCVIYANDSRIVTRWTSPIVRVVNTPPTPPVIWHSDTLHSYEELYWNKSVDIDGDPITYYVYGRRADEDEFTLLTIVTPSDGVRDTYEYDWSISETGLYQWYVVATDGEAETQSIVAEEIDLPNPRHIDEFVYMIGKGEQTGNETGTEEPSREPVKPIKPVKPKLISIKPEPIRVKPEPVPVKPVTEQPVTVPSKPVRVEVDPLASVVNKSGFIVKHLNPYQSNLNRSVLQYCVQSTQS